MMAALFQKFGARKHNSNTSFDFIFLYFFYIFSTFNFYNLITLIVKAK